MLKHERFLVFNWFRASVCGLLCAIVLTFVFYGQTTYFRVFGDGENFVYKGDFAIHFVDVGQGACTILQLPDGRVAVIDGGESKNTWKNVRKYIDTRIKPKRFDFVINSHPHSDHLTGLLQIMNTYKYDRFINYTNFADYDTIVGNGYKIRFNAYENNIATGENPNENMSVNEISPIITVEYANHVFVITGDAGFQTELDFMTEVAEYNKTQADTVDTSDPFAAWMRKDVGRDFTTYLQVGHHGSNNSTSYDFIDFLRPDFAVIPNGTRYLQAITWSERRLKERNVPVYTTRDDGNIAVQINSDSARWYFAFDNPPSLFDIWVLLIFSIVIFSFLNTRYCGEKLLTYNNLCNNI